MNETITVKAKKLKSSHFIYIDPNAAIYVDDMDRVGRLNRDELSAFVRIIKEAADNMIKITGERLLLNISLLSYSLVFVDPNWLAFTDSSGHIFINLVPLEGLEPVPLNMHLFHSILHEIAHRAHRNHDNNFGPKLVVKVLYKP